MEYSERKINYSRNPEISCQIYLLHRLLEKILSFATMFEQMDVLNTVKPLYIDARLWWALPCFWQWALASDPMSNSNLCNMSNIFYILNLEQRNYKRKETLIISSSVCAKILVPLCLIVVIISVLQISQKKWLLAISSVSSYLIRTS